MERKDKGNMAEKILDEELLKVAGGANGNSYEIGDQICFDIVSWNSALNLYIVQEKNVIGQFLGEVGGFFHILANGEVHETPHSYVHGKI